MGAPRKQRKKFAAPMHPWEAERIEREKKFLKEYGLKNKKEIWKMESVLKRFKDQIKKLTATESEQTKKAEKQLIDKLVKLGLIKPTTKLDEVLDLNVEAVLDRRLQSLVLKKGLAKSPKQARQFIVHGHIFVDDRKINIPSYLVLAAEEDKIKFSPSSKLGDEEHPERATKAKVVVKRKPVKRLRKKTDRTAKIKKGEKVEKPQKKIEKEKPAEEIVAKGPKTEVPKAEELIKKV